MKRVLSLLIALVFMQTQTWALSGGPIFTAPTGTDLTGTYAGVMVARTVLGQQPNPLSTASSTGVFSITVPISGAATGTTVFFQNNITYTGTIAGAANPRNRTITGIIQATSTALFTIVAPTPVAVVANPAPPPAFVIVPAQPAVTTALFAWGTLEAKVSQPSNRGNSGNQAVGGVLRSASASTGGVDANGQPISLGASGERLTGTAELDALFQDTRTAGATVAVTNSTRYSISGVRQTNAPATATGP